MSEQESNPQRRATGPETDAPHLPTGSAPDPSDPSSATGPAAEPSAALTSPAAETSAALTSPAAEPETGSSPQRDAVTQQLPGVAGATGQPRAEERSTEQFPAGERPSAQPGNPAEAPRPPVGPYPPAGPYAPPTGYGAPTPAGYPPAAGQTSMPTGAVPGVPTIGVPGPGAHATDSPGYPTGAHAAAPGAYPAGQPWQPGAAQSPEWPANGGYPPQGHIGGLAAADATNQRRSSRLGRTVATGTAAVVLAVGSGLLGGWVATENQQDDQAVSTSQSIRQAAAAPVINRSSLAEIAAKVSPSVVSITTDSGEGSGVILTSDGYILTNNHVVASAAGNTVSVAFSNGKTAHAKIIGTDPKSDLGVIKAEGVSDLAAAKFGDSDAMLVGDTVLAIGSPLGLEGSVTSGIVSALNRTIRVSADEQQSPLGQQQGGAVSSMAGLLQTDAAINPGNSGGALVDTNGEVIGINSAIATSGGSNGNIGVGFAIPSNHAKQVADALMKGQKVSHPFLGVSVTNADGGGALIGSIQPGSPAEKAKLQKGDVVHKLGGKDINNSDDLVSVVQTSKAGDKLDVEYERNGTAMTTTVTLGEAS